MHISIHASMHNTHTHLSFFSSPLSHPLLFSIHTRTGKSRVMSRINESQVTEGSTVGGDDDEEMFDAVTAASKGSGGLLPNEVTEMPMMIEEVQNR